MDRTGQKVFISYRREFHDSIVATLCLLKQTLSTFHSCIFPQFHKIFFPHTQYSYDFFSGGILHCILPRGTLCILNIQEYSLLPPIYISLLPCLLKPITLLASSLFFSTFARDMIARNISPSPNPIIRKTRTGIQSWQLTLDLDVQETMGYGENRVWKACK